MLATNTLQLVGRRFAWLRRPTGIILSAAAGTNPAIEYCFPFKPTNADSIV